MTKAELVEGIKDRIGGDKKQAAIALDAVLDEIMHRVANGNKVTIPGFGTFEAIYTKAREVHNVSTGGTASVPAKYRPKFKAGTTFKNACNT